MTVLETLRRTGQITSTDLAAKLGMAEQAINKSLYPHVATGLVVACTIHRNGTSCREYRYSGQYPKAKPGPKVGSLAQRANRDD